MMLEFVNVLLALGSIAGQAAIVLAVAYLLFFRKSREPMIVAAVQFLRRYGLALAFATALLATSGSLYYSQIAGFSPCELCWFQRIFMYPLVVLLGLALIKKERVIIDYALALAGVGLIISLCQNYMYYANRGLNALCLLSGEQVSCVKRYVFEFGYVTIPLMAATGFLLVITFLLFSKYRTNEKLSR
jgi:disulfide bond formation protein DsbB